MTKQQIHPAMFYILAVAGFGLNLKFARENWVILKIKSGEDAKQVEDRCEELLAFWPGVSIVLGVIAGAVGLLLRSVIPPIGFVLMYSGLIAVGFNLVARIRSDSQRKSELNDEPTK